MSGRAQVTDVRRWSFSHERLSFEVSAQRDHVVAEVLDCGYDESSRLGLKQHGDPRQLRAFASALREFAETIDAACEKANGAK